MTTAIPTMMRKVRKGMSTGGQFSGGSDSRPTSLAVSDEESMSEPKGGGSLISNKLLRVASSGMANSTSPAGCSSCQRPSIAAIFDG